MDDLLVSADKLFTFRMVNEVERSTRNERLDTLTTIRWRQRRYFDDADHTRINGGLTVVRNSMTTVKSVAGVIRNTIAHWAMINACTFGILAARVIARIDTF